MTCGILIPWPGIKTRDQTRAACSGSVDPNQWTAREVPVYVTFWGSARLLSTGASLFCWSATSAEWFQSLHILTTLTFCLFLITILMGVKWYPLVVFVCISPVIKGVEHLFHGWRAVCRFPSEKCLLQMILGLWFRSFCCHWVASWVWIPWCACAAQTPPSSV